MPGNHIPASEFGIEGVRVAGLHAIVVEEH